MRVINIESAIINITAIEHVKNNEGALCDIVIPFIGFHERMRIRENDFKVIFNDGTALTFDKESKDGRMFSEIGISGNIYRIYKEFCSFEKTKKEDENLKGLLQITYHRHRVTAKQDNGINSSYLLYFHKYEKGE